MRNNDGAVTLGNQAQTGPLDSFPLAKADPESRGLVILAIF